MRKRNNSLHIRISDDELQLIRAQAIKTGLPVGQYLVATVKDRPLKELPPMDFTEILYNLRKIGNSINQIAMAANAKGFVDADAYWENVRWLQESVGKLIRGIYGGEC